MRRSREVKAETHSWNPGAGFAAVSRARRRGDDVGDVMAEAGLTHGGFYRHFQNKDAFVARRSARHSMESSGR